MNPLFSFVITLLTPISGAFVTRQQSPALSFVLFLAQADPNAAIETFKALLAKILLLIGVAVIAYGGFLIARQGHTIEGILCIIGGFIIAIAVPLITYMAQTVGIA